MMKKLIVLALAMAVILCGSPVFAGSMGWGHGMGPGYGWSAYGASKLELTEDQTGKLKTLQESYLNEITPLQNKMIPLRSEMRRLWNAKNPDRDKIMAKQKEMSELQRQLDEKATQYRLEFRNVLTPEQQSKLATFGPGWKHGGRR